MEEIPKQLDTILREDIYAYWKKTDGLGIPEDILPATKEERDWLLQHKLVYYLNKDNRYYWFPTKRARHYIETGELEPILPRDKRGFRTIKFSNPA